MPRRTVITLCGSTKFEGYFRFVDRELTLAGFVVINVGYFSKLYNVQLSKEQKKELFEIHKQKIDMSDAVFVIDPNRYIGADTKKDIEYAEYNLKKIFYYSKGHFEQLQSLQIKN